MKPENVNPKNFKIIDILYNNNEFSIAYGKFEDGDNCLAMRWNGNDEDAGYPKTFGNPMWFIIHNKIKDELIKSLIGNIDSDKDSLLRTLEVEF